MLQHARHLPRGRGHPGNRHDRMPIDFQNFVRTIVNDGIARGRAPIARDQNALGKLECQNRGRFALVATFAVVVPVRVTGPMTAELSRLLRRSSAGKSSAAPGKLWSNPSGERSITDRCAGDSAWIDWDRPCAFFSKGPLYPVAKCPANADHRHRLVLVPTEMVPPAFECAQA